MNQNKKSSLNEANVNRFGFAQLQNLKNKITRNSDSKLSSTEIRARQIFSDKFVEKASAGLENAISTGVLSTNPQPAAPATQPAPAATGPSPEEIRKQKQAAAISAINKPAPATKPAPAGTTMPTKPYQVPGLGTNPNQAQTKAAPAQPAQKQFTASKGPNPQDYANFEKLIKTKTQVQRESKYERLNRIFESILNEQAPTISSFVLDAFKAFAHGPGLSDPALMKQAQDLANEVQATYAKDKGIAALRKLGVLGYAVATAKSQAPTQQEPTQPSQQPTQTSAPATQQDQTTQAEPAQAETTTTPQAYNQMLGILNKLDAKSQRKVIQALNQYVKMNQV